MNENVILVPKRSNQEFLGKFSVKRQRGRFGHQNRAAVNLPHLNLDENIWSNR